MKQAVMKKLDDLDWNSWQGKDPATLVFVVRDGRILLINKKTGLGKGKINGPGGKVEKGETPAERKLKLYHGAWGGSVDPVFFECSY